MIGNYELLIEDIRFAERTQKFDKSSESLEDRTIRVEEVFESAKKVLPITQSGKERLKIFDGLRETVLDLAECGDIKEALHYAEKRFKPLWDMYMPKDT